jgi:hypothetical protein
MAGFVGIRTFVCRQRIAFLNQLNALFNRVQHDGASHNFVAILLCGAYIKGVRGFSCSIE